MAESVDRGDVSGFFGKLILLLGAGLAAAVPGPKCAWAEAEGSLFAPPDGIEATVEAAPAQPISGDQKPVSVVVDEKGHKTLVVHGEPTPFRQGDERGYVAPNQADNRPQGVNIDDSGHKTLVIKGSASPEIRVDERGHKTLVIDGDQPAAPPAPPAADSALDPPDPGPKPYWAAEEEAPARPYFLEEEQSEAKPYWQAEEAGDQTPYWQVEDEGDQRPYWAPPESPAPAASAEPRFSPVETPAAQVAAEPDQKTISYYMYQDERGVKHLTNAPADPRYRLFTVKVTMQRGLAGTRTRFTHDSLRSIILRAARTHNLDPALIAAVIKSESAFDSQAVSWAGAQGLMQLMPGTARDMGCVDPFDPEDNVMGGSRYLRLMLDRFGDLNLAVAAYNCGPERVAREGRIPNIAETQNYVKIVLRNYERYKPQF